MSGVNIGRDGRSGLRLALAVCALWCALLDTQARPSRLGDLDEDGMPTIHDVVAILNHVNGRVVLPEDRLSFADLNRDGLVTTLDADMVAEKVVNDLALTEIDFNPALVPNVPQTRGEEFTFSGLIFPRTRVRIATSGAVFETVSDAGGIFSLPVTVMEDGQHPFFISGFGADGELTPVQTRRVLKDSEGPELEVTFPPAVWVTAGAELVVTGRVRDSLSGHSGLAVRVNGVAASVFVGDGASGSFVSAPVPLSLGNNTVDLVAVDALGNETTTALTVTRITHTGFRLLPVSGDRQEGSVGGRLSDPVVVEVRDPDGTLMVGKPVVFETVGGLGLVAPDVNAGGVAQLSVLTDANGRASVHWQLGTVAGQGNHLIRVRSRDVAGTLVFRASALAQNRVRLSLVEGSGQVGPLGEDLALPLRVWVNDGANALPGQTVLFQVSSGGGLVNGQSGFSVASGPGGFAEVGFRVGATVGLQQISASVVGQTGASVVFSIQGLASNSNGATSVSGLVMTPQLRPVSGALVSVVVGGVAVGPVVSNDAGAFQLTGVSPGGAELRVELPAGNASQAVANRPLVRQSLFLVAGVDNELTGPVILPVAPHRTPLAYDGTQTVDLTLEGVEGFRLTVPAGSIRRADGTFPSPAEPVSLSLTQIPLTRLPLRPSLGESPRIAWLLEPADLEFVQPPVLTLPDLAGVAGDADVGVFGVDPRVESFRRVASLEANGTPASFVSATGGARLRFGFGFANAGYQSGRATVNSGQSAVQAAEE